MITITKIYIREINDIQPISQQQQEQQPQTCQKNLTNDNCQKKMKNERKTNQTIYDKNRIKFCLSGTGKFL